MSDLQDDFQATVENFALDAREIERIEGQKSRLDAADPQVISLSRRAEEVAQQPYHRTLIQLDLAETAAEH